MHYMHQKKRGKSIIICKKCEKETELHAKGHCHSCYKKYLWKRKIIICKSCGRKREHRGFGLCAGCHSRLHHYDKVKEYNARKYHGISLEKLRSLTKKCVSCGFDKLVEIHHLDGDHNNTSNSNLIGLCPNCHKMIHNYNFYKEIKKNLKEKGYNASNIHPANYVGKNNKNENS